MTLLEAIRSEPAVAVSRLADEDVRSAIHESDVELIEVPHLAGRPLDDAIRSGIMRVRHWPNMAGYLETGHDNDIVVWQPSLATEPKARVVISAVQRGSDTNDRTTFLNKLMKRLERHRGVMRVCKPAAARGIVYSPGVAASHIDGLARRFPRAITRTPSRLSEFPGGLCLTITSEAWADPDAFAESVDELVGETSSGLGRAVAVG